MLQGKGRRDVREPPGRAVGKPVPLARKLPDGRLECTACARYCKLREGQVGLCGVRGVHDGQLWLYVYGRVITGHVDPIEKKPVTHYRPGSKIFSIATTGCNWLCHPKGTQILMAGGTRKPVEALQPGDRLWSYDLPGGLRTVPNVVTHVGERVAQVFEVRYGARGDGRFYGTAEHPLFTQDGWKTVRALLPGDSILKVRNRGTQRGLQRQGGTLRSTPFTCGLCGATVQGLAAWNRHRSACYAKDFEIAPRERARRSGTARRHHAMGDPKVARRAARTGRDRLLGDPNGGWHRNAARLRPGTHRHPSAARERLEAILDDLDVPYEREYRIRPGRRVPGAEPPYVADVALPEQRLDIEVDGRRRFPAEEVRPSDRIRDETLRLNGWDVVRISGSDVGNHPAEVRSLLEERIAAVPMVNNRMWLPVTSIEATREATVYSFECIPNHNYVGDGILSHNCEYCQNSDISQRRKVEGIEVEPIDVVRRTLDQGCQGLAYTYNQPSIFIEFARDIGMEARRHGIFNIFVSNGYDTPDAVGLMNDFLDCITVDFKGSGEREFVRKYIHIPDAEPIFQTLLDLRDKTNVHVEITDLVVPEVGDDLDAARKLSRFVHDELGPDTPIHFLRFHPDYKMMDLPWTPVETLEKHCAVAKEEGLRYVYIGNVPGHPLEHTTCPGCGAIAVRRYGFDITGWNLDRHNRCRTCGHPIPIVGGLERTVGQDRFHGVWWHA